MLKRAFCLALLALLWHGQALAADFIESVNLGRTTRDFQLHIPDAVAGQGNLPVVIVLHGGGGDAAGIRRQTGMDDVADNHDFMVVYPEGTPGLLGKFRTWNAGLCCGTAVKNKIDDVAFIAALIEHMAAKYRIDRRRIYATGHSNGAMMSYRLACELSDKIAAIAPNAGQRVLSDCHPRRPVPVLHIHGTADPCALYDGGQQCGGCFSQLLGFHLPNDSWPCDPVREVVKDQALMNGCSATSEVYFKKGAVTCERYKGCPENAAVALCSIAGAGHRWAGSDDVGPAVCKASPDKRSCRKYARIVGPGNSDVNAGEVMWDFFRNFSLPAGEKPRP